jgi:hypothetical protein
MGVILKYRRLTLTLLAMVNLLVSVVCIVELWRFYRDLDRPGALSTLPHEDKTRMLRTLHYRGIPPVLCLTLTSGLWFLLLRKETKQ